MSYDISFKVKVEGVDAWVDVGECDANVTWNVRKIIELSTGLPWKNEENNGRCVDVMPKITAGYFELYKYPEKYKPYEAENGWGTVAGTIRFFEDIISAWMDFQYRHKELVPVATFWIT